MGWDRFSTSEEWEEFNTQVLLMPNFRLPAQLSRKEGGLCRVPCSPWESADGMRYNPLFFSTSFTKKFRLSPQLLYTFEIRGGLEEVLCAL